MSSLWGCTRLLLSGPLYQALQVCKAVTRSSVHTFFFFFYYTKLYQVDVQALLLLFTKVIALLFDWSTEPPD